MHATLLTPLRSCRIDLSVQSLLADCAYVTLIQAFYWLLMTGAVLYICLQKPAGMLLPARGGTFGYGIVLQLCFMVYQDASCSAFVFALLARLYNTKGSGATCAILSF